MSCFFIEGTRPRSGRDLMVFYVNMNTIETASTIFDCDSRKYQVSRYDCIRDLKPWSLLFMKELSTYCVYNRVSSS